MANHIKRTIRLNPSQARSLSGIADRRGLSEYAMLLKVIDAGFLSVLHGTACFLQSKPFVRDSHAVKLTVIVLRV